MPPAMPTTEVAGSESATESAPAVWRAPRLYLLVPPDLAGRLHEPLRDFYAAESTVEVIVDRRSSERREHEDRRVEGSSEAPPVERRRITRRLGSRRAPQVVRAAPVELPRKAWPYADRLTFVQRMKPIHRTGEQVEALALLARASKGETDAYGEVYRLFYDRVFAGLRTLVNDTRAAEDLTHRTFSRAFDEISSYRAASLTFEEWLGRHARSLADEHLQHHRRKVT
jgi:hypothetical protein